MNSYPKIYNLGHKAIQDLLNYPVCVQEKIDGSQFSFGIDEVGSLSMRSKGCDVIAGAAGMFELAVDTVLSIKGKLIPGWTYRGEFLQKPKHNALAYDRVPYKNIILFDAQTGDEHYLDYREFSIEAERLGLERVSSFYCGLISDRSVLDSMLDTVSLLGGQKVEGIVIKQRDTNLFGVDGKALMGKYVSEAFREVHKQEWKESNPTQNDIVETVGQSFRTDARWNKSIQHMLESGKIDDSPTDIGPLMKAVAEDIKTECTEEIKERLFAFAWPKISRIVTRGLPEWYKEKLVEKQFSKN